MRILLICQSIAPVQSVAAIRWTKIAKYLKKSHEVHITVLTNKKDYDAGPEAFYPCRIDPLLKKDMIFFDEYWEAPNSKKLEMFYTARNALRRKEGKEAASPAVNSKQSTNTSSIKEEVRALLRDKKEDLFCKSVFSFLKTKTFDFDVVISSFSPIWTHLVAEKVKKMHPDVFWIADFRDPYAQDADAPKAYNRHQKFIEQHCARANVITRVTTDLYLGQHVTNCVKMITNGFDPDEALSPHAPRDFTIVFTGVLYGAKRDIGIICKAVKELEQEKQIENVRVVYAGPNGKLAKALAKQYDSEACMQDLGVLPREKALELQQNAAILLQLNWNSKTEHCEWSGKMYEYMMMRKPIIFGVTGDEPHSFPSRNMEKLGGVCYEQCRHAETYPALKKYIADKYREWKQNGRIDVQRDDSYVAQYSYRNIAEQVWEIIQDKKEGNV